jgi:uncharacterized coiled-coil protein SlyX
MTDKEQIKHLKSKVAFQKKLMTKLIDFFEETNNAFARESCGHNDGWVKVQKLLDSIEDEFDLTEIKDQL